jgi:hypothetical protein
MSVIWSILEGISSLIAGGFWVVSTRKRSLNDQAKWNRHAATAAAFTAFVHMISIALK